jgi:hypothetical protein
MNFEYRILSRQDEDRCHYRQEVHGSDDALQAIAQCAADLGVDATDVARLWSKDNWMDQDAEALVVKTELLRETVTATAWTILFTIDTRKAGDNWHITAGVNPAVLDDRDECRDAPTVADAHGFLAALFTEADYMQRMAELV